jgi:hypothetical protein
VDNRSPVGGADRVCRRLRELGAERPFLLATGIGTGEVPGPDEAEWCVVEVRAPDVVAEIRAAMRLLRLLPDEVVDALDRWGPERQALVLSPMFNELPQIAGRRVYGPRRPEWRRPLLPALGPRRAGRGRGGGLPGRPLRPGAGDAIPRGHPVQHPRDRVPRRGGHVPAGRDGHPAPSGVDPPENGAADATRELPVVFEGGTCRPADGRPADGVLSFGPSVGGRRGSCASASAPWSRPGRCAEMPRRAPEPGARRWGCGRCRAR